MSPPISPKRADGQGREWLQSGEKYGVGVAWLYNCSSKKKVALDYRSLAFQFNDISTAVMVLASSSSTVVIMSWPKN